MVRWLHRNRYGLLGAVLGGTVIGFAAAHFLDGRSGK